MVCYEYHTSFILFCNYARRSCICYTDVRPMKHKPQHLKLIRRYFNRNDIYPSSLHSELSDYRVRTDGWAPAYILTTFSH